MKAFDFGNGRIVECDTDLDYGYIQDWSNEDFLREYKFIQMKNYAARCKELGIDGFGNVDEDIVIDCLLKDVQEFGVRKILRVMSDFEITIAYAGCGMAPPGGPIPWD